MSKFLEFFGIKSGTGHDLLNWSDYKKLNHEEPVKNYSATQTIRCFSTPEDMVPNTSVYYLTPEEKKIIDELRASNGEK